MKPAPCRRNNTDSMATVAAARQALILLLKKGTTDLHLHTVCSDGSDTPEQLINRVIAAGLQCFAITDHDNLGAIEQARAYLHSLRISDPSKILPDFIAGVELSVDLHGQELHLLAYFPLGGEQLLTTLLDEQLANRKKRNQQMIERLRELGYAIDEQAFKDAGQGATGRLQAALLLIQQGYFTSIQQAFSELLAEGKPGYIPRPRPAITTALERIHQAGGVAVLAHPALYGWCSGQSIVSRTLIENLTHLRQAGLDGVEAYHGEATPQEQQEVAAAGKVLGLMLTAGSDDHGANKDKVLLYDNKKTWPDRQELLVVGALLQQKQQGKTCYFLCRRSDPGKQAGFWELPGGKVQPPESLQEALRRELQEELAVEAHVGALETVIWHDYPDARVILAVLQADFPLDKLTLQVHDHCVMVTAVQALDLPLLPADIVLFESLRDV